MAAVPDLNGLPPELRNTIWRMVLVSQEPVPIGLANQQSQGAMQPVILRVNRQFRAEAIGIYYNENTSKFLVNNFAGQKSIAISKPIGTYSPNPQSMSCCMGQAHWTNLLLWARACRNAGWFSGCIPVLGKCSQAPPVCMVALMMFNTAELMKAQPWVEVEKELEKYHRIAILLDPGWA